MAKATVRDVDLSYKRCFCRVDFNVPMKDGTITDDSRIRASVPTILYLTNQGAKVILASHLGRPGGKIVEELRLDAVAARLGEILGKHVPKLCDCVGPVVSKHISSMSPGDVVMLENVRFLPGEEKNASEVARDMAGLADVFVNDAFGTSHRAHASTAGIAQYIPAYAGLLMEKELVALSALLDSPAHPFVALVGGAKVSDKLAVLHNLLDKVDFLLVGGGMANTFLLAQGKGIGKSLAEPGLVSEARRIMDKALSLGKELLLPLDLLVAESLQASTSPQVVSASRVPDGLMALDIGPATRAKFASVIETAGTVFWNGPMGVFEVQEYRGGTAAVAQALAHVRGLTVVGGGDSVAAVEILGSQDAVTHLSTGGGAALTYLEGKELPGVSCLVDKR